MSNADRNQIVYLALFFGFAKENYYGDLSEEVANLADAGLDFYAIEQNLTNRERDAITERFRILQKRVDALGYVNDVQMILAISVAMCEEVLTFIKNEKKIKIWQELFDLFANKFTSDNTVILNRAVEILELINKKQTN